MQTVKRPRIPAIGERDACRIELHLIEREKANVGMGRPLLHLPHEKARCRKILGIVVKTGEYKGTV